MTIRFSLREHNRISSYEPDISFSREGATELRMYSTLAGGGDGYVFFVCDRAWLNGKYLRWRWKGEDNLVSLHFNWRLLIYDGEYDRSSDVDFPDDNSILIKGNGLLQEVGNKEAVGAWGPETLDAQVDVSGGSETKCTVMFKLIDAWTGRFVLMDIDWIEVNTGAAGAGNLYVEHFTDTPTMEVTGTDHDYGYVSSGDIVVGFPHSFGLVI